MITSQTALSKTHNQGILRRKRSGLHGQEVWGNNHQPFWDRTKPPWAVSSMKTHTPTTTEKTKKTIILSSCLLDMLHCLDLSTRMMRVSYTSWSTYFFRGGTLRPVSKTGKINEMGGSTSKPFSHTTEAKATHVYKSKKCRYWGTNFNTRTKGLCNLRSF